MARCDKFRMKKILAITIMIILAGIISILIFAQEEAVIEKLIHTDANFRVAFIGDQGLGSNSVAVLNLIKDENAQMVLHQGDFSYTDDPDAWDKQISDVLGDDFPYFGTIGGHDLLKWNEYQQKLYDRLKKIPDVQCIGDLGVKSSCTYKGLHFIQVGPGIKGSEHGSFIENQLNNNDHIWSVCSWAMNMTDMQTGKKPNKTGWEVYENCKNAGAIIATGHEHVYSRTKTLIDIENQVVDPEWSERNKLRIKEDSTFVFVSGIGGKTIRAQERCLPLSYPYGCNGEWANIYTSDQHATFGALFCTFNADGQPNKAYCYFKDIDGRIIDEFTITSFLGTYPDNTDLIDVDMSDMDLTSHVFSNKVIIDSNLSNTILIGADLSNAVLIGTTLTGADLTDANLTGVSLAYKDLTGTILRGADLTDANLTGVDLSGKDLTGTILRGADLTDANLTGVDLSGRDLTGAILKGVDLSDRDLSGTMLRGTNLSYSILTDVNLSGKDLEGTILKGVDLSDMDMTEIILEGADLSDANLSGQDLSDHDLTDVILTGANLSNSVLPDNGLSGRNFDDTIFNGVNLSGKNLSFSTFRDASFDNANMENTDLSYANFLEVDLTKIKSKSLAGANLSNVIFAYANLSGNNLDGAALHRGNFQYSNLSGTDFTGVSSGLIQGANFMGADLSDTNFEGISFVVRDNNGLIQIYTRTFTNIVHMVDSDCRLGDGTMKYCLESWEKIRMSLNAYALVPLRIQISGDDVTIKFVPTSEFDEANLRGANLSGSDLTLGFLTLADLTNADLTNADLSNAILTGANLTDANLTGAILTEAVLNCKNHPICVN
uniref:Putative low-complexity protein n=2 Tax=environmental samples TaxID=651140 RepID=A0A075G3J3_9ARCH|nr:putative low-complexity protein [uncultured marine thaumarchaeote KM3_03_H02]AIE98040.1 putative low-complexity protein [uncultured marine thaumarchaeote KM3_03_H03]